MAMAAGAGQADAATTLNAWLADWCGKNPPYLGPNWKCGQEASIRVMHLAMAACLCRQTDGPAPGLLSLVVTHLQRIEPTLHYALAQNNNHGTSEAAALFIGGSWLRITGGDARGAGWERKGRRWLEERVRRLVATDGSFSQYSVNYHRVLLDTLTMIELWRRTCGLQQFSPCFRERYRAATEWLRAFVDPDSGDAPNLGANDGARLLPFAMSEFRDFRHSVHVATAIQGLGRVYGAGSWDRAAELLGVQSTELACGLLEDRDFPDGGYARLQAGKAVAYVRYPRFRFRPSHADALHVDFWLGARNLLRDAGTYGYAVDPEEQISFSGVAGHNTVQFDERDQMPRIGRFLYGAWLRTRDVERLRRENGVSRMAASYRDWRGACHRRVVELSIGRLRVLDEIGGFRKKAVLRWRLAPGRWDVERQLVTGHGVTLRIDANVPVRRLDVVAGWESRYYLQKTELPVLEVEVSDPGRLTTEVSWDQAEAADCNRIQGGSGA